MERLTLRRIADLVTANAGLRIREGDYPQFAATIDQRVKQCGLRSLEEYYARLVRDLAGDRNRVTGPERSLGGEDGRSPAAQREWTILLTQLTVNESYFFRDRHQFQLLTQTLLPKLIDRKRDEHARQGLAGRPRLRLWSAGCSTGEEAYSLAIALNELQFPWSEWDVLIIGTDICVTALSKARQGCYGDWSFRQTEPTLRSKYFRRQRHVWQIREEIRQRVTFQYGNLVQPALSSMGAAPQEVDLILCRNVFIYFDQPAIAQTLKTFHRAMLPGGYLITGHTELYGQDTHQFQLQVFSESLVYQRQTLAATSVLAVPGRSVSSPLMSPNSVPLPGRSGAPRSEPSRSGPPAAVPHPVLPSRSQSPPAVATAKADLEQAQASLTQKAYAIAIQQAQPLSTSGPHQFEAYIVLAKAYANMGRHSEAKECCKQALRVQPLNIELHYLLAQIAEEESNLDLAKEHLRRIIYIDAYACQAYLELASLYQREHNLEQVLKMERLALKMLSFLPETKVIDAETGATVLEWRNHLQNKLKS